MQEDQSYSGEDLVEPSLSFILYQPFQEQILKEILILVQSYHREVVSN